MQDIRPVCFDDILGQESTIERLKIMSQGCRNTPNSMPHVLIDGPPGLGKTTIAGAIARELGEKLYIANAASIRSVKSIIPYLMNIESKSVLFIDEIHRLPKLVEEFLYPVMEDFRIDMLVEGNPESIQLPVFTLVGATTNGGSLSQPFYDRFTIKEHLSFYDQNVLAKLARSNSLKMGITLTEEESLEIGKRSKGTPRIMNARLQWYSSYKKMYSEETDMDTIFMKQGIDSKGFDENDRKYLSSLSHHNPLGLKNISSLTGISMETIENGIEPFMIRMGYVMRTQKGRILRKVE